jgi:hypothetical protein
MKREQKRDVKGPRRPLDDAKLSSVVGGTGGFTGTGPHSPPQPGG